MDPVIVRGPLCRRGCRSVGVAYGKILLEVIAKYVPFRLQSCDIPSFPGLFVEIVIEMLDQVGRDSSKTNFRRVCTIGDIA